MNTFYFDSDITLDTAKNLAKFLDGIQNGLLSSTEIDFVVESDGGDVGSSDLIIFLIKDYVSRHPSKIRFLIIGACNSSMFNIVYALRAFSEVYLGSMAYAEVHVPEILSSNPRNEVLSKSLTRVIKQTKSECINFYKDALTPKQLRMVKKGLEVPIEIDQLTKIFNAKQL